MTYNQKTYKKCNFVKMSSKGRRKHVKKKEDSGYTQNQKLKIMKEWKEGWFKGMYELAESE
tara:strand:- start:152 stop:334 length:183 start_codon:yes stop_codon:yes gene_type:complete